MTGNIIKVVSVIILIICALIGLKYSFTEYDKGITEYNKANAEYNKALIESAKSQTTEQFKSQSPTTGKIDKVALFDCKSVFVENTIVGTEECLLDIVTNNSDTITVSIAHEENTFKYHDSEISIGDTIEYRVNATFRLDAIDSINGVVVEHEE